MPEWGSDVSTSTRCAGWCASRARLMPDVGVQIPPNLSDWWLPLVEEGATDLGGLSANGDHISPEHPFPSPHKMRRALSDNGYALAERLCVYPQYMDSEWLEQGVLDVIKAKYWSFIPRRGSGRREERAIRSDLVPGAIERARDGDRLSRRTSSPRCSPRRRPEAIEDMRQAADELRAELAGDTVTFVVNRNINVSNICIGGLRVLRLRPGQALARRLRARPRGVRAARERGGGVRRHRDLHAVGHPSRLGAGGVRALAAAGQGGRARSCTCTPTRRWRSTTCARCPGLPPLEVFHRLREAGPGLHAGTAAEVLDDGVRERISPNKLPVARWVEIIEASHAAGPALHRDRDVRPHRGAVGAGRAHARRARAAGAHRRVHRVRAALVHPVPHAARAAPTESRRSRARRTSSTRPSSGSRWAARIPSLQASWVKMGLDAATEALRWGVNDLGGTLMEESDQPDGGQPARRAPGAGGPDRGGARGGQAGGGAHHAVRDPQDTPPSHALRTVFTSLRLSRR